MMKKALVLMIAMSAAPLSSPVERSIVSAVNAHNGEALALLEKAVNINSGTHNFAGVRAVGDLFRREFDALGFKTTWVDGAAFHRAGHLVADHPGPGPRIVLIGHLDTVFEQDSPFQKFERIDAKTARGPGVIDMKGGDVIMVAAMKALRDAGVLKDLNVVVVFDGDEEDSGDPKSLARQALVDASKGARYAIGFEDGSGNPHEAITARRGVSSWKVEVTGKTGHSSQIFREDLGAGANYELARILDGFRRELSGEAHLTLNPSLVLGGTALDLDEQLAKGNASGKTNVIPEHAVAIGDLRTLSKAQLQHARDTMKKIVADALPQTRTGITFEDGYPALAPTDGNARLLADYDKVSQDLGLGPVVAVTPDRAGAADVAFIADEVPSIIDGVGLCGHDDHSPGETADLTTLPTQTQRAAVLLYRLSHGAAR